MEISIVDFKYFGGMMVGNNQKLGFIGAGNMATALIKGIVQSKIYRQDQLRVSDKDEKALKKVRDIFGLECYPSNEGVVRECSTVVLCVKPQNMQDVLGGVKDSIRDDHLLISIAAGIPLKKIGSVIDREIALVRVMPNTPALVQKGISALAYSPRVTPEQRTLSKRIFSAVGDIVEVEEGMMDAVTALSGSGPGYVFRIMECMVNAGVAVGLKRDASLRLVVQTFLGTAHLAKESELSLNALREKVTSPGGTTAEGLAIFNRMGIEDMTLKSVEAACNRSRELGKG